MTDVSDAGCPPADAAYYRDSAVVAASFVDIAPHLNETVSRFYAHLCALDPHARTLFPVNMQTQRHRFARFLTYIVDMLEQPATLARTAAPLGTDHRKFEVTAHHYPVFGQALLAALADTAGPQWTPQVAEAWQRIYQWIAHTMITAADAATGPASVPAVVTHHHKHNRDTATVQVRTEAPLDYRGGQHLSVEIPQRPRVWRSYSPTTAPDPTGLLTFHIKAISPSGVSRAIVSTTRPGDHWRIGPPQGQLHHHADQSESPLLLLGGGTGIAPILAILDHLDRSRRLTGTRGIDRSPNVVVCYGARRSEELHALADLRELTNHNPWLTLIPAVEHDPPPGTESGTLPDVITRYGAWNDHTIILSGSPHMLRTTIARMIVAGTPSQHIHYDPFTLD